MGQGQAGSDVRETRRQELVVDTPLEVWCSFDNEWVRGFAVHEVNELGVVVRRTSDGAVLPKLFQLSEVRIALRRH